MFARRSVLKAILAALFVTRAKVPVFAAPLYTEVESAGQTGHSLVTHGLSEDFHMGEIFTIAGVFGIDHVARVPCAIPRHFVVTAHAQRGDRILQFYPPIIPLGLKHPTVARCPQARAEITLLHRHSQRRS